MPFRFPEKFEKSTRWAYLDGKGTEVGPFSATEMMEFLARRVLTPETMVVELTTRKSCGIMEVGPFGDFIRYIVEKQKRDKAEKDFETTKSSFAKSSNRKLVVFAIAAALLLAAGIILAIINPFRPKAKDNPVVLPEGSSQGGVGVQQVTEEPKEPEFQILEADVVLPENEGSLAKSVLEEGQMTPTAASVTEEVKMLDGAKKRPAGKRKTAAGRKPVPGGPAAAGAEADPAAGEEPITTMDFSEEEGDDGAEPAGGDGAADLARSRLRDVMKKCGLDMIYTHRDIENWHLSVTATVDPSGRIKGLKITADPSLHVGELKLCASAELEARRVPPFDGPEIPILVTVDVSAH